MLQLRLSIVWVVGILVVPASSQSLYFNRWDYPLNGYPSSLASADFDGDGKVDLLATANGGLHWYRGLGDGRFQPAILTAGRVPFQALIADFNGDGKLDVAGTGGLWLGNGDGTFRALGATGPLADVLTPTGYIPNPITADFNEDGLADVAGSNGSSLLILLGDGRGSFQRGPTFSGAKQSQPIVKVDVNADRHADLALWSGDRFRVLVGSGRGTFSEGSSVLMPFEARLVATGDFRGDGYSDWVVSRRADSQLFLIENSGGSLAGTPIDLGANAYYLSAEDFNVDGKMDLLLHNSSALVLLQGLGDGSFESPKAVGSAAYYLVSGDWNQDGRMDVATIGNGFVNVGSNVSIQGSDRVLYSALVGSSPMSRIAPGAIATLYGADFATVSPRLQVRDSAGQVRPAKILYASANQINLRIPEATALGLARIELASADGPFVPIGRAQIEADGGAWFECGGNTLLTTADAPSQRSCGDAEALPATVTFYGTGFANATVENTRVTLYESVITPLYVGPGDIEGTQKLVIRVTASMIDPDEWIYGAWVEILVNGVRTGGGYTGLY